MEVEDAEHNHCTPLCAVLVHKSSCANPCVQIPAHTNVRAQAVRNRRFLIDDRMYVCMCVCMYVWIYVAPGSAKSAFCAHSDSSCYRSVLFFVSIMLPMVASRFIADPMRIVPSVLPITIKVQWG